MTMTHVALGCSQDTDYNFLLPMTALLWREHIGHHPLALLVGSAEEWRANPRLTVALDALNKHEIPRVWLGHLEGYQDATLAQNCRQHLAASLVSDDDWIFPADADLWPLRPSFYHAHTDNKYKMVSYYWQGDHFLGKSSFLSNIASGKRTQTIPTCHVAMRAKDWRAVYGLTLGEDIAVAVKRTLDNWFFHYPKNDFNVWMSDQDIMTEHLCRQEWFPLGRPPDDGQAHAHGEVLFIPRPGHPPLDRLCRSVPHRWDGPFDPMKWTDAHMHKNPAGEAWANALKIIAALLPQHVTWAKQYHKSYVEASR